MPNWYSFSLRSKIHIEEDWLTVRGNGNRYFDAPNSQKPMQQSFCASGSISVKLFFAHFCEFVQKSCSLNLSKRFKCYFKSYEKIFKALKTRLNNRIGNENE